MCALRRLLLGIGALAMRADGFAPGGVVQTPHVQVPPAAAAVSPRRRARAPLMALPTAGGAPAKVSLPPAAPPFPLRAYQSRIVSEVGKQNAIVLLPTGAGKTAIAAELIRVRAAESGAPGGKILFLVPTVLLVGQQAGALREWCANVGEYFGGAGLPPAGFRVLVATPRAFAIAQAKRPDLLGWGQFGLVFFDEVHHVLKEHPYRKIALSLKARATGLKIASEGAPRQIQVVGLTASLSYAVEERRIRKSVEQLTRELDIDVMSTASEEELRASGYHGNAASAEVVPEGIDEIDVPADKGASRDAKIVPESERKPHMLIPTFWSRVADGQCTDFTKELLALVRRAEASVAQLDAAFATPLGSVWSGTESSRASKGVKMADWGKYARARRQEVSKVGPPGRGGRAAASWYWDLEQLYEALKILVTSWEEDAESAVMLLEMMLGPNTRGGHYAEVDPPLSDFVSRHAGAEGVRRRLGILKRSLLEKFEYHEEFRGIVFVQQRVSTHILAYFLSRDPETAELFRCAPMYAADSPATASLTVTKRAAADTLKQFAAGELNLLISTVVAEEGMDVPSANCVVRYDPVLNAVSHMQGRGRARQTDSSFVVLAERKDRPVAMLQGVGEMQGKIAAEVVNSEDPAARSKRDAELQRKEANAQRNREVTAFPLLKKEPALKEESVLGTLNLIAKKTKVEISEVYKPVGGGFECILEYSSCLRVVQGEGRDASEKGAKKKAALALLMRLRDQAI
mmetsp:Transcript_92240/g.261121  ORF Transcript_92240/g.261121 Transcript_92240/m.261121 type:complete len:745 (-) Transcript_92240:109-2343(-)